NRFYRGAQPDESDYKDLKALGVKTVIDLTDNPEGYEKRDVEALGMRYVSLPMSDSSYPKPQSIDAFLKLVNDPATGTMFVHCAGGRHRTGVMGAVYRYNVNHWNFDQVYAEMVDYDFYTKWGHGDLKTFVEDYGQKMASNGIAGAATSTTSSAPRNKRYGKWMNIELPNRDIRICDVNEGRCDRSGRLVLPRANPSHRHHFLRLLCFLPELRF